MQQILVIEDDKLMRGLLRLVLEHSGYNVVQAENGRDGVKFYRQNPTDLVITDLIMPGQEGLETIRELKREFPEVNIIAISGGGFNEPGEYLHVAELLGARRTLAKPFHQVKLLRAVRELLE